ncbi:hypothetical protein GCM10027059_17760 [Myceligenerans halotolerans]
MITTVVPAATTTLFMPEPSTRDEARRPGLRTGRTRPDLRHGGTPDPATHIRHARQNAAFTGSSSRLRAQYGETQTYQVVSVSDDELVYEARTTDGTVVDGFTEDKSDGTKVVTDH